MLVISFLNAFEIIIFDLKYILELIYCIQSFTDNGKQTCPMFLPILLASKRTVLHKYPGNYILAINFFCQKFEVFADMMLNTSGIC